MLLILCLSISFGTTVVHAVEIIKVGDCFLGCDEETDTYPSEKSLKKQRYKVVGVESWDVLYIRPAPHTKNKPIGSIPYNGTNVEILKRKSGSKWVYVRYQEFEGWAHSRMLAPQN